MRAIYKFFAGLILLAAQTIKQSQGLFCLKMIKFFVLPQLNALVHAVKYTVLKCLVTCVKMLLPFLPEFESLLQSRKSFRLRT